MAALSMMAENQAQLDDQFLSHIVDSIRGRGIGRECELRVPDLDRLTKMAVDSLAKRETLLDIRAPINVCGDIHGNIDALLCLLHVVGWPPGNRFLFLGK